eukprot:CAMPEP_0194299426 /NCGR_PEP_ID=MMETSP0169-20130528/60702_1 /TAXON_ID=218684 /ORGANISM="Corethron pennatum, Strain L29A3" /LENGTH=104 /DNA_ID=CAMNT_0039049521 /DNA_START=861 /DNA_END=1176 /DNA_ORIENTATION=-
MVIETKAGSIYLVILALSGAILKVGTDEGILYDDMKDGLVDGFENGNEDGNLDTLNDGFDDDINDGFKDGSKDGSENGFRDGATETLKPKDDLDVGVNDDLNNG